MVSASVSGLNTTSKLLWPHCACPKNSLLGLVSSQYKVGRPQRVDLTSCRETSRAEFRTLVAVSLLYSPSLPPTFCLFLFLGKSSWFLSFSFVQLLDHQVRINWMQIGKNFPMRNISVRQLCSKRRQLKLRRREMKSGSKKMFTFRVFRSQNNFYER